MLKEKGYRQIRISLFAPVEQCIRNDRKKGVYGYGEKAIREVYPKLISRKGHLIDATDKKEAEVFRIADKYVSRILSG